MKPPFSNPKFSSYYPFQEEAIQRALSSDKKVVIINGPPGTGKSLIGMSIAFNFRSSLYLCHSKPLQHQLIEDFPEYPILQGRNNYPCVTSKYAEVKFPEISCDDCIDVGESTQDASEGMVSCKGRCIYNQEKKKALRASLAILNMAYFVTETNYVGRFSGREMMVVDECDLLEASLLNFVEVSVSDRMLLRLKLNPPEYKTKWESWKEWAAPVSVRLRGEVEKLQEMLDSQANKNIDTVRGYKRLTNLLKKMVMLGNLVDENWIYQEIKEKTGLTRYSFRPTWISDIAKEYFWKHAGRFILMSGTPPMPKTIGLEQPDWEWIDIPNQFPVERRPVYYLGVANLTNRTMEEECPKIIPAINNILHKHTGDKGLIHTVSYSLSSYIMSNVNSGRLITHPSGIGEREKLIRYFKESNKPFVMVSPSMERGIDLPFDYCRFVIIVKVPFPDLGDKRTARRLYSSSFGQVWYRWVTVSSIIQMSMRGMRDVTDSCCVYLLDQQFENLYAKANSMFSEWWKEALKVESNIHDRMGD